MAQKLKSNQKKTSNVDIQSIQGFTQKMYFRYKLMGYIFF